ncbi:MAG: hypothetical protein MEQ07_01305 [Aquimonas sp.]|nr:hypothetical protein [Aquimonas sp.]
MPNRLHVFSLLDAALLLVWLPCALLWAMRPLPVPEGETIGALPVLCALISVVIVARQCFRLWGWDEIGGTNAFKLGLGLFLLFAVIDFTTLAESRLRAQQILSQLNFLLFAGVIVYGSVIGTRKAYSDFFGRDWGHDCHGPLSPLRRRDSDSLPDRDALERAIHPLRPLRTPRDLFALDQGDHLDCCGVPLLLRGRARRLAARRTGSRELPGHLRVGWGLWEHGPAARYRALALG